MPDRSHALRVLQHHLRQAGSLLAAGDFEAASGHVDAALAIDPVSPAALTLRDRIQRATASASAEATRPAAEARNARADSAVAVDGPVSSPPRFVPKGVDPVSWVSFESRIEERRFRSLVHATQQAIARGEGLAARLALEEARELRPDASELDQLNEEVALLPTALPVEVNSSVFRARTVRAASILAFGVTLVMGIDWLRSDTQTVANADVTRELDMASLDEPGLAAAVSRRPAEPIIPESPRRDGRTTLSTGTSGDSGGDASAITAPEPAARPAATDRSVTARSETARAQAATPTTAPIRTEAARTTAVSAPPIAPRTGEVPDDYVAPRASAGPDEAARIVPRGEVPDDYVAPQAPQRASVDAESSPPLPPLTTPVPSGARGARDIPAATTARNTVSRDPSLPRTGGEPRTTTSAPDPARAASEPSSGSAEAAPAAAAIVRRDPEGQVTGVLEQYAQAYGNLDARAARRVWPTVDEQALAQDFASLQSQRVTFEDCAIDVNGEIAKASCRGSQRYVRKVGSSQPRTEPRSWEIGLVRNGEDWVIDSVRMSR